MSAAKVRIVYANGFAEERAFGPGQYRIGRDTGDIVLRDPNVSGSHGLLTVEPSGVLLTDTGSTNGTFTSQGQRLTAPLALGAGDWVRMGGSTLVLVEAPRGGTQLMPQVGHAPQGVYQAPAAPAPAPQAFAPHQQQQPAPQPFPQHAAPLAAPQPFPQHAAPLAVPQPFPQHAAPLAAPQHAPAPQPFPQQQPAAPQPFAQYAAGPLAAPQQQPAGPQPFPQHAPAPHHQQPAALAHALPVGSFDGSAFSHPEHPVRHSYPLAQAGFGLGDAVSLLVKTAPYVFARLAILFGVSMLGLTYWIVNAVIGVWLGSKAPLIGWVWFVGSLGLIGWFWRAVVRYFLYLLKAGHIAVLTELITKGQVGNGSEGMFAYGKRIVKQRFGEVNVLFAVDLVVDGVVRAFNRTLDWVSSIIPVPGLDSVVGFVKAVLRASTTYIDESIFSYNLARGDENVFRSSKDGLIYYAQNSKEILKTGVWVVILEKVLSFLTFIVIFIPTLLVLSLLPLTGWGVLVQLTAIVTAWMFTYDLQQAVLKPLFLTMVMLKYHAVIQNQPINLEWDQRLTGISEHFREITSKAAAWVKGQGQPSTAQPQALPAVG